MSKRTHAQMQRERSGSVPPVPKIATTTAAADPLPPLTDVQIAAIRRVCNPQGSGQGTGVTFFVTGEAGAGKSVVTKAIIRELNRDLVNNVYVTGSTGVAGIEIDGTTTAAFLGVTVFGDTKDQVWVNEHIESILKKKWKVRFRLQRVSHLIIDEVSMLGYQFWLNMDLILRRVRGKTELPYGGVTIVATGDFFQLPPVVDTKNPATPPIDHLRYFAFQTDVWKQSVRNIFLPGSHRQAGYPKYAKALSSLRRGIVTDKIDGMLQSCVRPLPLAGGLVTHLYPYNKEVDARNKEKLHALKGSLHVYKAEEEGPNGQPVTPCPGKNNYPECRALPLLELKKGAQVMLLRNMRRADLEMAECQDIPPPAPGKTEQQANEEIILANGAVGVIIGFEQRHHERHVKKEEEEEEKEEEKDEQEQDDDIKPGPRLGPDPKSIQSLGAYTAWPVVSFPAYKGRPVIRVRLEPHRWEKKEGPRSAVVASRTQVPLLLAYAMSANKCQGQTITCNVVADIGSSFTWGMAYVMLSRVQSMDQLYLTSYKRHVIKAHPAVVEYYEQLVVT